MTQRQIFRARSIQRMDGIVPALLLLGLLAGGVTFWLLPAAHWWIAPRPPRD